MGLFSRRIKEAGVALVKKSSRYNNTVLTGEDENNFNKRMERYRQYRRAYDRIPLVTAIIDVQADQAVQSFYFEGPNKEKLAKFADKANLMRFFHRITKSMLIYGNAYVEVNGNELKVLNPIWMDVWRKPTGEIIGYTQIIEDNYAVLWGTTGNSSIDEKFSKHIGSFDMLAHFKYNVLGSEKYGTSVIESLMISLQQKLDMEDDLKKVLFKYVAPLIWAKVGTDEFPANETAVSSISSTLRGLQAESEVTTSHLVDLSVLDFNAKGMDINTPITHIEQQIITGGQVPPVLLGREGKGKADSEVQLRNFGRHIKSIQRELKYEFEDQIIVGQGLGTPEDKLIWEKSEEREWEIDVDIIRGLVTDGVITPQIAIDLLPPRFREKLPVPDFSDTPLNQQSTGIGGQQKPRPTQRKKSKVTDNPNDPTQTTKNKRALGKRVNKTDREVPIK